jgi:hypothetical protein
MSAFNGEIQLKMISECRCSAEKAEDTLQPREDKYFTSGSSIIIDSSCFYLIFIKHGYSGSFLAGRSLISIIDLWELAFAH